MISLINQIYHYFHHHVFLFGFALGNHQREGNECVVGQPLGAVLTIEYAVVVEEPEEKRGSNALVAVAEGVVLCDEIKQHGGFFLHARIEFLASKGLVNLSDTALEGIILLVAEQATATEFSRSPSMARMALL